MNLPAPMSSSEVRNLPSLVYSVLPDSAWKRMMLSLAAHLVASPSIVVLVSAVGTWISKGTLAPTGPVTGSLLQLVSVMDAVSAANPMINVFFMAVRMSDPHHRFPMG